MEGMTALQLEGLREFYRLEPFGVVRDDLRIGQITAQIHNYLRKPGTDPLGPPHFLLFSEIPKDLNAKRQASMDRFHAAVARGRQNRLKRLAEEARHLEVASGN